MNIMDMKLANKRQTYLVTTILLCLLLGIWHIYGSRSSNEGPFKMDRRRERAILEEFGRNEYMASAAKYPLDKNSCHNITDFTPNFVSCTHDTTLDQYISSSLASGHAWEPYIADFLMKALSFFPGSQLLDVGANLGSHSLLAAAAGTSVWAVDPLAMNLQKIYQSAEIHGTLSKLRLLHHVVDWQRGPSLVTIFQGNIGETHVIEASASVSTGTAAMASAAKKEEAVKAILLIDIFDAILEEAKDNITVIIKIDIERFQCKAFLGSKDIFSDPRIYIPYIAMEWNYASQHRLSVHCTEPMVTELTNLFMVNGYSAFGFSRTDVGYFRKMDEAKSNSWNPGDVLWKHQSAPFL